MRQRVSTTTHECWRKLQHTHRVADSPQPTIHSCELVTLSDAAQPEELTMQRLPRRAATHQRQLVQELIQEDLI